ncbi:hypothetical protein ACS0TY_005307 [Phlomoides rotata]
MLEKLHLHPRVLKFSGAGGVPNRFADSLNSLKVLNLSMYLYSMKEVAFAFCLARSSPNLQMLRVTGRSVKFANFSGSEPEVELLRYLLASAAGLEEMVITPYDSLLSDDARYMFGSCIDSFTDVAKPDKKKIPPTLEPGAVKEKLPEAHYDDHDHQKCIKDEEDAENAKKYEWSKVELHLDLKRENHPWTSSVFSLESPDDAKLGYGFSLVPRLDADCLSDPESPDPRLKNADCLFVLEQVVRLSDGVTTTRANDYLLIDNLLKFIMN